MIRIGAASLRANGISIMLFGFYTVYSSLFLSLGRGREGFILGACRQGICFIPVILLLPMVWGLNGIMYAQPIADVLSAVITVFMAIPLHKKLNEMQKQSSAISKKDND
jgi:Na+-driven multidrug efflux pump